MNAPAMTDELRLRSILAQQRDAFTRDGAPSAAQRQADLNKLKRALLARRKDFEQAVSTDFGHRSPYETMILDFVPTILGIDYLRGNLRRWMRPRRRHVALHFMPGRARVIYQPLGVVGIIAPWNYPIGLALMPLATAIAAGDRAMIKPSEFTPATSELLASVLREIFSEDQVAVVPGGPEIGAAFAALPFDHLIFTGSTSVGRKVMRAASENLVPVTLELGGKSPVIVDHGFPLPRAAASIAFGKLANAGQTCVAPDYAFVPEDDLEGFVAAFTDEVRKSYPDGASSLDYGSVINGHHYDRLTHLIEDARAKGARIITLGQEPTRAHTLAPTIILDATPDMQVMQEEIFGPILPILSYKTSDEAIAFINARPRPLALYMFSENRNVIDDILARTVSGDVTINDTLLHYVVDDLPFGGVGASGMGAYHGEEGFRSLSHAKGVFQQSRVNFASLLRAPFGRMTDVVLKYLLR